MKPNPRMAIPVVIVGLLVAGYFVDGARAKARSTLSGFFESRPTKVASRMTGRVSEILVHEGDTVRKGQKLLVLEADAGTADASAKGALAEQAHQVYAETEAGARVEDVARQSAVVAELEATLAKLRHGPLPEEIASARDRVKQAMAAYAKAKAGPREEEIAQAKAAERQARARLAQAERGPTKEEKAEAKARMDAAKAQAKLAGSDFQRTESLYNDGAVSKRSYDAARATMDSANAQAAEAEQAYKRAKLGTPDEELTEAKQGHKQAKAALDLLLAGTRKEDLAAAKAVLDGARAELRLLENGTRQEDLAASEARLAQARAQLDLLKHGNRKEQIAQAKAAAQAAKLQAASASDTLGERIVVAPCDGVVERIVVTRGDLVSNGSPLIQMYDPADVWLRVYVPEAQLASVKVQDGAELAVDGIEGVVSAYVETISTTGEFTPANLQTPDERGKQVFAVQIRMKKADPRIKAGMYVTVKKLGHGQ